MKCETCGGSGEHLWFDCPTCGGDGEEKMSDENRGTIKCLRDVAIFCETRMSSFTMANIGNGVWRDIAKSSTAAADALASQSTRIAELERERDEAIKERFNCVKDIDERVRKDWDAALKREEEAVAAANKLAIESLANAARLTAANEALRVGEAALDMARERLCLEGYVHGDAVLDTADAALATIRTALEGK